MTYCAHLSQHVSMWKIPLSQNHATHLYIILYQNYTRPASLGPGHELPIKFNGHWSRWPTVLILSQHVSVWKYLLSQNYMTHFYIIVCQNYTRPAGSGELPVHVKIHFTRWPTVLIKLCVYVKNCTIESGTVYIIILLYFQPQNQVSYWWTWAKWPVYSVATKFM